MRSKATFAIACLVAICAASLLWWRHAHRAVEQTRVAEPVSSLRARAEQGDPKAEFDFGSFRQVQWQDATNPSRVML